MGSKQLGYRFAQGFAYGDYEQATAKKRTRRERFLSEMEKVVPWKALLDLIDPYYPKPGSKGGHPPYPLQTMLRIHLLEQWYDLSDPAMEDALIEVPTMRRFAGISMISDRIPDETTILAFRHLLEKHDLGQQIFEVPHCQESCPPGLTRPPGGPTTTVQPPYDVALREAIRIRMNPPNRESVAEIARERGSRRRPSTTGVASG